MIGALCLLGEWDLMKRLQGGNATMIPEAVFVEECKVRFLVRQCIQERQEVYTDEVASRGCLASLITSEREPRNLSLERHSRGILSFQRVGIGESRDG
jgi:hypothetical protein